MPVGVQQALMINKSLNIALSAKLAINPDAARGPCRLVAIHRGSASHRRSPPAPSLRPVGRSRSSPSTPSELPLEAQEILALVVGDVGDAPASFIFDSVDHDAARPIRDHDIDEKGRRVGRAEHLRDRDET
jgi:hypothetical protein